ncbi:MAG TPA: hypothetical protein DCM62_01285 [Bacteroidales bacterium]|nr:hypothetical protein [Bacteroidales bacterium]
MSILYFAPSVIWITLIFVAISLPPDKVPSLGVLWLPFIDKAVHFTMFFVLAVLQCYGAYMQKLVRLSNGQFSWIILAAGLFIGLSSEAIQHFFVLNRTADILDMLFNIFGTIFGLFAWVLYLKIRRKNNFQQKHFSQQ